MPRLLHKYKCDCHSCTDRLNREFWSIIDYNYIRYPSIADCAGSSNLVDRTRAYGYNVDDGA